LRFTVADAAVGTLLITLGVVHPGLGPATRLERVEVGHRVEVRPQRDDA